MVLEVINNDSDNEKELDLDSLASQILSDENNEEFDEFDEDYEDEDDEDSDDLDENEEIDSNEEVEVISEEQETINKAHEILSGKKSSFTEEVDEDIASFGNYEIIYNDGSKSPDKFSKLVEDTKIDEDEYDDSKVIVEKIRNSFDKYPEEREEIQKFLLHNDKEIKISEARSLIEACLFVLGSDGLNAYDIKKVTNLPLVIVSNILDEMVVYYAKNKNRGLKLVQYGNKYKFVTKPQHFDFITLVLNKKERKALSDSVLETLAIIAYNQPCTKATIEKIRNKSCINTIERLKELGLIEADERSEAIGKPWLYSVTQKFFDLYGIKSLSELPIINRNDKNYGDEVDIDADFISEINEE